MSESDLIFFATVAVLACNHAVLRIPGWLERVWLFWGVQALNLAAAVYLILVGLPGFEGTLAIANWMFGLLFIYHIISNNRRLQRALAVKKRQNRDGSKEEKIRAALKAGEE